MVTRIHPDKRASTPAIPENDTIANLRLATTSFPQSQAVWLMLGDACQKQKRFDEAYAAWSKGLALSGSDAPSAKLHAKLSRAAEALGDRRSAVEHARACALGNPKDTGAQNRLLRLDLELTDMADRREHADRHFELFGRTPLGECIVSLLIGLDEDAEAAAARLRHDPSVYQADAGLAARVVDELLDRGLTDGLPEMLEVLCAAMPEDLRFPDRRVKVLHALGAPRATLVAARRALAEHPRAGDRHRLRYARAALQATPDQTLRTAELVLSGDPDNLEAAVLAIRAAYRLERNALAASHLEQALARDVAGTDGPVRRATLLTAAGRFSDVLVELDGRADGEAMQLRANSAWEVGDYKLGIRLADALAESGEVPAAVARRTEQMRRALHAAPREGPSYPDALFEAALAIRRDAPDAPEDVVVIVTSNLGAGGAERQVALTASNMSRLRAGRPSARTILCVRSLDPDSGHDVMLPIAQHPNLEIDDLRQLAPAAALQQLERLGEPAHHLDLVAALPEPLSGEVAKLYLRFVQLRPRVVHLWQDGRIAVGSFAAVLAGVPRIVASIRNVLPEPDDRRRYRRYLPVMYNALGKREDVVFTTNSQVAAYEYASLVHVPAAAFAVIRNGLEVLTVRSRAPDERVRAVREELGLGDAKLVGGVFRLAPAKRPGIWITTASLIAAEIPDARFLIVGDGVLREEMRHLARDLGLADKLIFAGQRAPVEPWMAAMDVFLLTSAVEGLPNVLLEAQALGVPVVTTDAGGAREAMIDKVTGRLVEDETPENLARAVSALLRQRNIKEKSRVGGPSFIAARFSVERMLADTLALYGTG